MKGISFGQYYPADSVIHRLDPRTKVILTVLYIVLTFLCKSAISFGILLLSAIVIVLLSKIPLGTVLRSLRAILFIVIFTSVINIFATKGEMLLTPENWFFKIYAEGLWRALFMVIRISVLIVGSGIFLTYTTTPIALTYALESLLSPLKLFKIPVHDFAMMMSIALRFIPTLSEETEKIMNAQKARGADFTSGNLIKRAKALIPILVPLFVSAFNRAFELASAMECRCYNSGKGRTQLRVLKFGVKDWIMMILTVAFGAALILLNTLPYGYVMN